MRIAVAVGWLTATAGCLTLTLGAFADLQPTHRFAAMAASFIPYGVVAWLVATIAILFLGRRWVRLLAVVTVAALVVQIGWTRPYWPHEASEQPGPAVTVMSLNMYYGWADLDQVTAEVERTRPDIVVLQEVTVQSVEMIESARWRTLLPHHIGEPAADWSATNMMVFSRHPLTPMVDAPPGAAVNVVRVAVPTGPVTVVAVHTTNPVVDVQVWASEISQVEDAVRLGEGTPTIALGDFNAVREHQPIQRLLRQTGMTDAAEDVGAGWQPTYPGHGGLSALRT